MFDFQKEIILENERVLLRPLQKADFEQLLPISQNSEAFKWLITQVHSPELLQNYIQTTLFEREQQQIYPFVIFDKKQQKYAGCTCFMAISNLHKRIEIGSTWIGKDFQETGLNRNCKFLLLQYIFEELKFERAELKTDGNNLQSQQAIAKIGGKLEGILRNHTQRPDGTRRDTVYFSILASEWHTVKNTIFKTIQ